MATISGARLPDNSFAAHLPPLSREALMLRLRLAEVFLRTPDAAFSRRALRLVERAHARFERREKSFRENQQQEVAA